MKIKFLRIYRLILILAILMLLAWLLNKNVVIDGQLFATRDFCDSSLFISDLYPKNRVGGIEYENKDCFQRIFVEPAYFEVKVPRTFSQAKVKIIYANPDQDLFELGLMKKKESPLDWNFTLKPIENKILDNLDWELIIEEGISLWQKQKRFDSIYEFVNNVPDDKKTATFYYQFSSEAIKDSTLVMAWDSKIDLNDIDYIIAQYQAPKIVASQSLTKTIWQENSVDFLVGGEYMNNNHLEFIFSAPDLTHSRQEIKIKRVEIELIRPATNWSDFFNDLKNYFLRKISNVKNKF